MHPFPAIGTGLLAALTPMAAAMVTSILMAELTLLGDAMVL